MGRVSDCKQRLWAQVRQKKRKKELWHPTVLFSCRPNTKYGENIFQSGGKAAQDQAQGAVDMWWGPFSKCKLNLFCILHCTGTPRSRTTLLGQSRAREALSQDISPRSWGLLTSFVNVCMQKFDILFVDHFMTGRLDCFLQVVWKGSTEVGVGVGQKGSTVKYLIK